MTAANAEDVARIFPNAGDHAILEIVNCGATIAELDAAALLLQDDDEAIRDIKIEMGERLSRLVRILRDSDVLPLDRSDA